MTPELRQRLLDYAKELVDQKIEQRKFSGGHRATVTDRMVSLDVRQPQPVEEEEDLYIRVWAELTYTQIGTPGYSDPIYLTKTVTLPIFPVFTLKPPESQEAARQAQLDQMAYYLENAEVLSAPNSLLYFNYQVPLVLASNYSSWSQYQYPPYYPAYPGSLFYDPELYAPFRVGGPSEIFLGEQIGDPYSQFVEASAQVTLYVRGHSEESLGQFENGGATDPVKLTLRQVGTAGSPGSESPIVQLQEDVVGYFGKSFSFSTISTASFPEMNETVSLVGFEPR